VTGARVDPERIVLAVHGGAGPAGRPDAARDTAARAGLAAGLAAGMAALRAGGGALDAVEEAVRALEACEVLNAGRGSVLNAAGEVEMDACIVEGSGRGVGALAAVRRLVHPVSGARLVMEQSPHVLLVGEAADRFGAARGLETAEPGWFVTSLRRSQLERAQAADRIHLDHAGEDDPEGEDPGTQGTVGAVARDAAGHLAAATSTGGVTNQWPGRIGDTPLVGAGTWADDATCAVSATGPGELFIRCGFAHEVDAGLRLRPRQPDRDRRRGLRTLPHPRRSRATGAGRGCRPGRRPPGVERAGGPSLLGVCDRSPQRGAG
jgi:isoaspartyl peptidase/L-asparaginase-like protein (Ntn-hydrolase superfamily)